MPNRSARICPSRPSPASAVRHPRCHDRLPGGVAEFRPLSRAAVAALAVGGAVELHGGHCSAPGRPAEQEFSALSQLWSGRLSVRSGEQRQVLIQLLPPLFDHPKGEHPVRLDAAGLTLDQRHGRLDETGRIQAAGIRRVGAEILE